MIRMLGASLLLAAFPVGALGALWLIGTASGGEWNVQTGSGEVSGWLVGAALAAIAIVLAVAGVRMLRARER